MSISEYIAADSRYKDPDVRVCVCVCAYHYVTLPPFLPQTKSTYTLDARSEFAASLPLMMQHEESITGRPSLAIACMYMHMYIHVHNTYE